MDDRHNHLRFRNQEPQRGWHNTYLTHRLAGTYVKLLNHLLCERPRGGLKAEKWLEPTSMSQFPVSPRNPEIYTSVVVRRNVQTLSDVKKQVGPSLTIPRGILFQRLCWFEERPFLRRVPFADDSKNVMSFAFATTGKSELSSRGFLFPLRGMFLPTIELEEKK